MAVKRNKLGKVLKNHKGFNIRQVLESRQTPTGKKNTFGKDITESKYVPTSKVGVYAGKNLRKVFDTVDIAVNAIDTNSLPVRKEKV